MPVRTKPTRELLARILANYRQTGDLTNAAIRSGISRSTIYAWKARGEKAKSGLLAEFAKNFDLAREEEIAVNSIRHKHLAQGGVHKGNLSAGAGHRVSHGAGRQSAYPHHHDGDA